MIRSIKAVHQIDFRRPTTKEVNNDLVGVLKEDRAE
jgi:hypothetical protein